MTIPGYGLYPYNPNFETEPNKVYEVFRTLDQIPIISTLSNLYKLFHRAVIAPFLDYQEGDRSFTDMVVSESIPLSLLYAIPLIGNIAAYFINKEDDTGFLEKETAKVVFTSSDLSRSSETTREPTVVEPTTLQDLLPDESCHKEKRQPEELTNIQNGGEEVKQWEQYHDQQQKELQKMLNALRNGQNYVSKTLP